jgi:hypothetical protein
MRRVPQVFKVWWLRFVVSHPFARKKAKGWGTVLKLEDRVFS